MVTWFQRQQVRANLVSASEWDWTEMGFRGRVRSAGAGEDQASSFAGRSGCRAIGRWQMVFTRKASSLSFKGRLLRGHAT